MPSDNSIKKRAIRLVIAGSAALLVSLAIWFSQESLLGVKPTKVIAVPKVQLSKDQDLTSLRSAIQKDPTDLMAWTKLAEALERKYYKNPDQNILLELVQVLSEIVKRDQQNTWALLTLADISFDRQVFDKAQNYYQDYLKINTQDHEVRSRYASTLMFTGDYEEALAELDLVLETKPKYFQALAFKAISLSEMGDKTAAKELATQALALAPNAEAKARFEDFLKSIDLNAANKSATSKPAGEVEQVSLEEFIKNHPILGAKIVELKKEQTTLQVILKEFPIAAMPEFAKASLIEKIKSAAQKSEYKKIAIYDQALPAEQINIDLSLP